MFKCSIDWKWPREINLGPKELTSQTTISPGIRLDLNLPWISTTVIEWHGETRRYHDMFYSYSPHLGDYTCMSGKHSRLCWHGTIKIPNTLSSRGLLSILSEEMVNLVRYPIPNGSLFCSVSSSGGFQCPFRSSVVADFPFIASQMR